MVAIQNHESREDLTVTKAHLHEELESELSVNRIQIKCDSGVILE